MKTIERCMCGATDCWSCGPAQGYGSIEQDDIDEKAREIALERLYENPDEFFEAMEGMGSQEIYEPLRRALKVLSERKQWNNSGWIGGVINQLEQVKKILESEQVKNVERFEDEAINQLSEET